MTALLTNKRRYIRNVEGMLLGKAAPTVSTQYWQGGLLCFSASDALVKAALTDGVRLAGVCPYEELTGVSVAGQLRAFEFGHEEWFPHSGLAAGSIGKDGFVLDDNTLTVGPGAAESDISFPKAVDGAANTTTAETVVGLVGRAAKVIGVRYAPAAALTADNTNNAVITVSKRATGGGSKTTIASITTNVASGNWTAWSPKDLVLTATAADLQVAANSEITFEIAKGGTGVAVPAGTLEVLFGIGVAGIRAGELMGFETIGGVAGVWCAVGRYSNQDA